MDCLHNNAEHHKIDGETGVDKKSAGSESANDHSNDGSDNGAGTDQGSDSDDAIFDLEALTLNVVTLFREGHREEALEVAIHFADDVQEMLGRTHPIYINSLATVAALVEGLGNSEDAGLLLQEAEDLHEELEIEVMEQAYQEHFGDDSVESGLSERSQDEDSDNRDGGAFLTNPTDAPTATTKSNKLNIQAVAAELTESREGVKEVEEPALSVQATPSDGSYSSDSDWSAHDSYGSSADVGDEGCNMASDDAWSHSESDEGEAQAITELTQEVNFLLKQGDAEGAAKLLTDVEKTLFAKVGYNFGGFSGISKAAFHTLWAAILESVGEEEKAQLLYDEAITVLEKEAEFADGQAEDDSETTHGTKEDSSTDVDDEPDSENSEATQESRGKNPCENDKSEVVNSVSMQSASEPRSASADPAAHADVDDVHFAVEYSTEIPEKAGKSPTDDPNKTAEGFAVSVPETPIESPKKVGGGFSVVAPSRPKHKSARPTILNQRSPATAPKEYPKRAGGGFAVVAPSQPKRTSTGPKVAETRKNAKRVPQKVDTAKTEHFSSPQPPEIPPVGEEEKVEPEQAKVVPEIPPVGEEEKVEPEQAKVVDTGENPVTTLEGHDDGVRCWVISSHEQDPQLELESAMRAADMYLGLLKFDDAASKLWGQVEKLSIDGHALKFSEAHVRLLVKYGGVLWWKGDAQGAIDNFRNADAMLEARDDANTVDIRCQRTEIWSHLAQVYRAVGDFEEADNKLTEAICSLSELRAAEEVARAGNEAKEQLEKLLAIVEGTSLENSPPQHPIDGDMTEPNTDKELDAEQSPILEALRGAQADLAQVCVQKKEYQRASDLYVAAFGDDDKSLEISD